MNKVFITLGYVFTGLLLVGGGFYGGYTYHTKKVTPTNEEVIASQKRETEQKEAITDIYSLTDKYKQLSDLCEEKYQSVLNGGYNQALVTKGKADAIKQEIDVILRKYGETEGKQ